MFGGRIAYHITDTVALWFRGDVAGFGISDSQSELAYNLIAGLNWRFTRWRPSCGWRYMHVDIEKATWMRTSLQRTVPRLQLLLLRASPVGAGAPAAEDAGGRMNAPSSKLRRRAG